MMDFLRCKQEAKKTFVTCLGVTQLIINEQDVSVRTCKKVEYTLSKLYENKGRAWKSHQRHNHKVQRDFFWCRWPQLYGVFRWTLKVAGHRWKSVWTKVDGWCSEETCLGWAPKKYCDRWWHDDRQENRWSVGSWGWFHVLAKQILRVDFMAFVDHKSHAVRWRTFVF